MSRPTTSRSPSTSPSRCAGPLLVNGEPGTGKTLLAEELAAALGRAAHRLARQVDDEGAGRPLRLRHRRRLHDCRFGDERVHDIANYIKLGPLGEAFASPKRPVLLIDEIDKADIEFPERPPARARSRCSFDRRDRRESRRPAERPIVVITSNNEKELPDAFLRRCVFHYIEFPDRALMEAIVDVHLPDIQKESVREALSVFYDIRDVPRASRRSRRRRSCSTG